MKTYIVAFDVTHRNIARITAPSPERALEIANALPPGGWDGGCFYHDDVMHVIGIDNS